MPARQPPELESQTEPSASAAASSPGSSTSSPYTESPGPGFDAKQAPPEAPAPEQELPPAFELGWEQDKVESWLTNAGDLAHATMGVADADWAMTKADLERIAPPLTRILNRYEPMRAVAAYSDPASVAVGFGMYGWRSALERAQIQRAQEQAKDIAGSVTPLADGDGPAIADEFIPAADRLRATRPPEAQ